MFNPFGNPFTPLSEDDDGFEKFIDIMRKANTVIYGGWFIYFCAKAGANSAIDQKILGMDELVGMAAQYADQAAFEAEAIHQALTTIKP